MTDARLQAIREIVERETKAYRDKIDTLLAKWEIEFKEAKK